MKIYAVIMAGGVGSRFWPKSRETMPKQFQAVFGEKTLFQRTWERITKLVKPENVYVITNQIQRGVALSQVPELSESNVIAEPFGRNTAPCIATAASVISSQSEESVMIVLPSDHLISQEDNFIGQLKNASQVAYKLKSLVTLGIRPTHPETGFGYIHFNKDEDDAELKKYGARRVLAFKEKPDLETAIKFVESGEYLWNSGMFVWRTDVIVQELEKNLVHFSDFYKQLQMAYGSPDFEKILNEFYLRVNSISVDYAVMEKASNVVTIPSNFIWSDVGSWDEVYRLSDKDNQGNTFVGDVISFESSNNFVMGNHRLIALVGIEDLVVVETDDALLICRRGKSQSVKEIVDILRKKNRQDLI